MSTQVVLPYSAIPGEDADANGVNANFIALMNAANQNSALTSNINNSITQINNAISQLNTVVSEQRDELLSAIEERADAELSNVTQEAKRDVAMLSYIDRSKGVSKAWNTEHAATQFGFVEWRSNNEGGFAVRIEAYVNGVMVNYLGFNQAEIGGSGSFQVSPGDVYRVYGNNSRFQGPIRFYPARGEV